METKRKRRLFLLASIILYAFSLYFSAFCTKYHSCDDNQGIVLLIFGIFMVFTDPIGLIWLANPFLLMSWFTISYYKTSLFFSGIAFVIMLLFIGVDHIPNYGWCGSFLESEPCPDQIITRLGPGYFLWLTSAATVLIYNLTQYQLPRRLK